MAILKCKMCGGELNLVEGASTAECEYCGSVQTVPKVDDEKKLNLFARANRLRAACDFDKAAGIYESIVADFPEEAEAYWGLVLCKYGIEYVDDPATGKKIPTCHRSAFESVMKDANVELAQEYADIMARRLYREEAKQIEELREGIIEVSANEDPYDVFICYKETNFEGKRTLDSVLAMDMYDALTDKGYRVFFSRISLEDKLGTEYEPYIFAALNSAKIMLVIGTDFEYFNAVWVKNEWSRFLKLMAQDKSKHLIPCYKGIDAYDMPEEFARLQAQDLDKMGAIQDIVRGVQKLLPRQTESMQETVVVQQFASNAASLLKRAFMFLEDGEWGKADDFCEQVLNLEPENPMAYIGKLMVELRVRKQDDLLYQAKAFSENSYYQKAIRFGDEKLRLVLSNYIDEINRRIEEERIAQEKRKEEERIAQEKRKEEERIAQEKRKEEERIAQEKRDEEKRIIHAELKKRLPIIREKLRPAQGLINVGDMHVVCLRIDGTVVAVGLNSDGQCNVSNWRNIVALSVDEHITLGLKADGTVVATGKNDYGQCRLSNWNNIVAISADDWIAVGLKSNGTVVAAGVNARGQCNVSSWQGVVDVVNGGSFTMGILEDGTAVSVGYNVDAFNNPEWRNLATVRSETYHTVGLKHDGTVVATGNNDYGRCNVGNWDDIVDISISARHTVGLRADGTVVAVGDNTAGQCNVESWENIVEISAGSNHTVGLKADGTVVATGSNQNNACAVDSWRDIVAIDTGYQFTVGLKSDGTLVATGFNLHNQCNVSGIRLFNSYETMDTERQEHMKYRTKGLCQHCGGELKGMFSKKCVVCGKPKDY